MESRPYKEVLLNRIADALEAGQSGGGSSGGVMTVWTYFKKNGDSIIPSGEKASHTGTEIYEELVTNKKPVLFFADVDDNGSHWILSVTPVTFAHYTNKIGICFIQTTVNIGPSSIKYKNSYTIEANGNITYEP